MRARERALTSEIAARGEALSDLETIQARLPHYRSLGGGPYPELSPGDEWRVYLDGPHYPFPGTYRSSRDLSRFNNEVGRLRAEADHLAQREAFLEQQLKGVGFARPL